MPINNLQNSVTPFRTKHQTTERASPETAAAAFAAIRNDLDGDPMAAVWNEKLTPTQKRGLWIVAGLRDIENTGAKGGYWLKWRFFTDQEKASLNKVISTFAGLAVRIKGVAS